MTRGGRLGVGGLTTSPATHRDFVTMAVIQHLYTFRLNGHHPSAGKLDGFVIRVSKGKIVLPNSTCPVKVSWPRLDNDTHDHCRAEGLKMYVEPTDQNRPLTDVGEPALVGGASYRANGHTDGRKMYFIGRFAPKTDPDDIK